MKGLKISFEKGGTIKAGFLNEKSSAVKELLKVLPIETEIIHTRWCGREIYMPIETQNHKLGSDLTENVSKFDLVYWLEQKDNTKNETISLFYGAESLQFYGGPLYVEIIGRVGIEQEKTLDQIGHRIWLEGKEKVRIEILD